MTNGQWNGADVFKEAGSAYTPGPHEITPFFGGVHIVLSFVLLVLYVCVSCSVLFVFFRLHNAMSVGFPLLSGPQVFFCLFSKK